ncbi:IS21 family transposase [Actinokineospora sp.]|uniref:IS21 family transposase n=1 Tax=Actinokineospora sp. TaxID=1872133 RepID=UPI003D6BB929
MIEIKEVLRLWLSGHSLREVTRLAGLDRKTVRRYVQAAQAAGVARESGDGQLTDEVLGAVVAVVRPDRPRGNGASWEAIAAQREQIAVWLKQDLTLAKIYMLLGRRGVVVPYRTLHRFAVAELGFGRRKATVPVVDGKPGQEVQVDFGRLGLVADPATGRRRVGQGLIFTAVYSRHMFVYPTLRQTLEDVVAGFEAAWLFFGGVFAIVVPDNMKTIVDQADAVDPRLNDAFREYAQSRGFAVDPARVRHPRDKPRVERCVQYARSNFFAGEDFRDIDDCRERASTWCAEVAGTRIHGTTQLRPGEVFEAEERPVLLPAPTETFAVPSYTRPKVAPDRHIEVARALYSVPGDLVGQRILARADGTTVKLYWRGQLIKVHPDQQPGRRRTDPADLPSEVTAYAMRDLDALHRRAAAHGEHIAAYTTALLEHPLPWTKMRQVYRLLGLVRRHGADAVDVACGRALEAEAINVGLIDRMLTRGLDGQPTAAPAVPLSNASRFVRDSKDFTVRRPS